MFKNAGIKSVKEAYVRVLDGEVFYYNGEKILYDPEYNGCPLRIGSCYASFEFHYFGQFMVEVDWRETLEEKSILCWLWDHDGDEAFVGSVIDYRNELYRTQYSWYYNATPLTKKEIQFYMDNVDE